MIIALAGGVGGAKLADGLYQEMDPETLTVLVNTADDTIMHGLHISPDLDTVMYTLANLANPETGWGIAGDTFQGLEMLERYGAPHWFRLGDRDIATHILRTMLLREGRTLTEVTIHLTQALGIRATLLPMCDARVETLIQTEEGTRAFQEYFVRYGTRDTVVGIIFQGIEDARPSPLLEKAMTTAKGIVFCPSNPLVSIGPILSVPGIRDALRERALPLVVVSPIIAGEAVRGPAAKMLMSMGMEVSPLGIAKLYADLQPVLLIDEQDAALIPAIEAIGVRAHVAPILMETREDRRVLAQRVLMELALLQSHSIEK